MAEIPRRGLRAIAAVLLFAGLLAMHATPAVAATIGSHHHATRSSLDVGAAAAASLTQVTGACRHDRCPGCITQGLHSCAALTSAASSTPTLTPSPRFTEQSSAPALPAGRGSHGDASPPWTVLSLSELSVLRV